MKWQTTLKDKSYCSSDYLSKKLIRLIENYEYVSFDVYDTLITRMVNKPSDIFGIVEQQYNSRHPANRICGFLSDRAEAEERIRKTVPAIDKIYAELRKKYSETAVMELMNIEIEVEYDMCVPLNSMKKVYEYCLEKKKHIYVISDMYLKYEQLKSILDKCGYTRIERILISCESSCEKKSGKLYAELIGKRAIHIGDSWRADFLGAIKERIKPIHVRRYPHFNEKTNIKKITQYLDKGQYFENIGIGIIGPLLIAFSYWLNNELENTGIQKIYFLSREGKIIKEVFDSLFRNKYETRDLFISRRVLTVACYGMKRIDNLNDLLEYLTIKKNSTVKDMAEYLDLEVDDVLAPYAENNIYTLSDNENVFFHLNAQLLKKSNCEAALAAAYFNQEEMRGSVAIVDIGWKGTMQKCLCKFFESSNFNFDINIKGYYIELFQHNKDMFSFVTPNHAAYSSILDNPLLMENLLQSTEGSTIGYKKENDAIIPIKRKSEFDEQTKNSLRQIRKGVKKFVEYWEIYGYYQNLEDLKREVLDRIDYFICNPKKLDLDHFKCFAYSDIKEDYIIPNNVRISHIKSDFYSSAWKYGYLRQLIGTNFNNKKIISILKRKQLR